MAKEWQTVTDACQRLGISQRTLYRRIGKGDIESKLEDGRRLVLADVPDDKPVADTLAKLTDTQELEQLKQEKTRLEGELENLRQQHDERGQVLQDLERKAAVVEQARSEVEHLREQIQVKDKEIDELHQLLMTEKRQAQLLLEYKQPFWRRIFGRGKERT